LPTERRDRSPRSRPSTVERCVRLVGRRAALVAVTSILWLLRTALRRRRTGPQSGRLT